MPQKFDAASVKRELSSVRRVLRSVWGVSLVTAVLPVFLLETAATLPVTVSHTVSAVVALAMVVVFVVLFPRRRVATPHSPRIAAGILGVVSVCFVWGVGQHAGDKVVGKGAGSGVVLLDAQMWPYVSAWLVASVFALAALLVAGSVFEMARKKRVHLIESLSTTVAAGAFAWCAGGWVFLAEGFAVAGGAVRYGVLAVVVLLSLIICAALPWGTEVAGAEVAGTEVTGAAVEGGKNAAATDSDSVPAVAESTLSSVTGVSSRRDLYSLGLIPVLVTGAAVPVMVLLALLF